MTHRWKQAKKSKGIPLLKYSVSACSVSLCQPAMKDRMVNSYSSYLQRAYGSGWSGGLEKKINKQKKGIYIYTMVLVNTRW